MRQYFLLVGFMLIAPASLGSGDRAVCESATQSSVSDYRRVPLEGELLRIQTLFKYDPTTAFGDFDGDGRTDVALLLERVDSKVTRAISVCLSTRQGKPPVLIESLYVNGEIHVTKKGTPYHDFETGKDSVYLSDGITVACCECCGATYMYKENQFTRVVDGD
jgi:hypothetical protein